MKAFKIKDDIVAAHNKEQAIGTWAHHFGEDPKEAGSVTEIDPVSCPVNFEQADGSFEVGSLADIMPEHDPEVIINGDDE